MARRKVGDDLEAHRLLNLWAPSVEFGRAIGCVATTFTLDAGHFEEQCLARFLSMDSDPNESARVYLVEREEKLSQVFACVLVDQRHAENQRSLRWHLLPIRLPGASIQHAKVSFMLWNDHLRIVVGSANLTAAGYRTNREVAAVLEFAPDGGQPLSLARDCIDFLERLATLAPGSVDREGPRTTLAAFLNDAKRRIGRWNERPNKPGQPRCELIPVLPTAQGRTRSVPAQLMDLWRGPAATGLTVVSPFFDQMDSAIDRTYDELSGLITSRGPRTIEFRTAGRKLADGQIEVDIPKRLAECPQRHDSTEHELTYVELTSREDGDALRPLHAKSLVLQHPNFCIVMLGSSNCTVAGLGLYGGPNGRCNTEMNVSYVIPGEPSSFLRQCLNALPPAEPAGDTDHLIYTETPQASEENLSALALLPTGFSEALFVPGPTGGNLELRLEVEAVPPAFEVSLPSGEIVLSAAIWTEQFGKASHVSIATKHPMSVLKVRWLDDTSTWQSAPWVVNASDTALLPSPEILKNLSLEELLELLTSAQPIHWAFEDRGGGTSSFSARIAPTVDPLKKVDSSQFLMRRMRRLARALEGMRLRLEQPVPTLEGLRWRLLGPLGPLALSRALQAETGAGGPFFIAEVCVWLQEVQWTLGGAITQVDVEREISTITQLLKSMALQPNPQTPQNLRDYVSAQLEGLSA